jgi:hypothetical protein
MSAMPSAYRDIIDPLIEVARGLLEQGESLTPIAFVGNLTTGRTTPIVLLTSSETEKNQSVAAIRQIAELHEADFVFVLMEAWTLPPDKARQFETILERYGSIGASPYAVDSVSFTLETRHGLWVAQCNLKPKGVSKKRRTFTPPSFQHFTDVRGRFADLLPGKDGEGDPPSTLH